MTDSRHSREASPSSLFGVVVEMTGLSCVLGDGVVRHLLDGTGTEPERATRQDYVGILDELEGRMAIYMPRLEAKSRRHRIAHRLSNEPPDGPTP